MSQSATPLVQLNVYDIVRVTIFAVVMVWFFGMEIERREGDGETCNCLLVKDVKAAFYMVLVTF